MAARTIDALAAWEYTVSRAPDQKVEDKVTLFLSGGGRDVPYPSFVLDTTRMAFSARPGSINEKNPGAVAANTSLNTDLDVPTSCADALRTFDGALQKKVEAQLVGTPFAGVIWHSLIHEGRTGSGYADTMTLRITGWIDYVSHVTSRVLTYKDTSRNVPGSVSWHARMAKTQPLREKETAFFKFGNVNPVTGAFTYRSQSGGGRMVSPGDFNAGAHVKVVFTVSHVLVTIKYLGSPKQEVHANAVLVAKEVYEQPKPVAARGALLLPGVMVVEEEEEEGEGGDPRLAFSSSTEALSASPPTKKARTAE